MPFLAQTLFYLTGIVLLLASSIRQLAARKLWKAGKSSDPGGRYKVPPNQQIESALFLLGTSVCFAVSFPEWWLRAAWAILALGTILKLFCRFNLRAPDSPFYDPQSVLQLSNGNTSTAKTK
jgi:hypothetical protein